MSTKFKELKVNFTHRSVDDVFRGGDIGSIITGVAHYTGQPGKWRAYLTDNGTETGIPLITANNDIGSNSEVFCTGVGSVLSAVDVPLAVSSNYINNYTLEFRVEKGTSTFVIPLLFGDYVQGLEPHENANVKVHFLIIIYGSNIS